MYIPLSPFTKVSYTNTDSIGIFEEGIHLDVRVDVWGVVSNSSSFPSHPFLPQVPVWIIHPSHRVITVPIVAPFWKLLVILWLSQAAHHNLQIIFVLLLISFKCKINWWWWMEYGLQNQKYRFGLILNHSL